MPSKSCPGAGPFEEKRERTGEIMRALVCALVAVMMLAGAALFAMGPASAGSGDGQAQSTSERAKAMPFKPGSEPAKGFADADLEWGADVREFPKLTLSACDVYGFADLCLYRVEVHRRRPKRWRSGFCSGAIGFSAWS